MKIIEVRGAAEPYGSRFKKQRPFPALLKVSVDPALDLEKNATTPSFLMSQNTTVLTQLNSFNLKNLKWIKMSSERSFCSSLQLKGTWK